MKIAILSDIHGNCIALDAVLDDIHSQGEPDEYWVLGDLAAFGPQPNESIFRLHELPNTRFVRGNTDRYITKGDRPPPSYEDASADPDKLPILVEVASSISWTQGMITAGGWFDFMDELPLEQRMILPNGTRLLGVHASPGEDDGPGVVPDSPADQLDAMFANCEADLVCIGHTHWPANRRIGNVHVINLGCVSNSRLPSMDATYVLLDADESGYSIEHRMVAYDRAAVAELVDELHHPGARFIKRFMQGQMVATQYGEPEL